MKIVLEFSDTLRKAVVNSPQLRAKVKATILARMELLGQALVGTSRTKYLSGRPGLRVVSGNLRRSINYKISGTDEDRTLQFGTNVVYARIHEYGGTIVPVRAKFLHFVIEGRHIFSKRVHIPARPFLAPSMEEEVPVFARTLNKTLLDLVNGELAA